MSLKQQKVRKTTSWLFTTKTVQIKFSRFYSLQGFTRNVFLFVQQHFLMRKTRKSIAKRFKKTGTGKLLRRTPGYRHFLRSKSVKRRRRAGNSKLVAPGQHANLIRGLPFA